MLAGGVATAPEDKASEVVNLPWWDRMPRPELSRPPGVEGICGSKERQYVSLEAQSLMCSPQIEICRVPCLISSTLGCADHYTFLFIERSWNDVSIKSYASSSAKQSKGRNTSLTPGLSRFGVWATSRYLHSDEGPSRSPQNSSEGKSIGILKAKTRAPNLPMSDNTSHLTWANAKDLVFGT